MNREQIMQVIRMLAKSQGFYSRLLENLMEMRDERPDELDNYLSLLESKNFQDELDIVLYFES